MKGTKHVPRESCNRRRLRSDAWEAPPRLCVCLSEGTLFVFMKQEMCVKKKKKIIILLKHLLHSTVYLSAVMFFREWIAAVGQI